MARAESGPCRRARRIRSGRGGGSGLPGQRKSGREVPPGGIGRSSAAATIMGTAPLELELAFGRQVPHVLGRPAGCRRLGGMVLGRAQVDYGGGQHGQTENQSLRLAAQGSGGAHRGQAPCREAQLLPCARAPGNPAVRGTGGAVVGIRCAAQLRVLEDSGRDVQDVRCRPYGVRASRGIREGVVTDVLRRCPGQARGMFICSVPLRDSDPARLRLWRRAAPGTPALAQLRQRQVSRKPAAAIPDHSPALVRMVRQADRVARVTWPGFLVLTR